MKYNGWGNYKAFDFINPDEFLGHELCSKLAENKCDVKSYYYWVSRKDGNWHILPYDIAVTKSQYSMFPAYRFFDILVTHADEFFENTNFCHLEGAKIPYNFHAQSIWLYLKDKKYKLADKLIWDLCKFNKDNK